MNPFISQSPSRGMEEMVILTAVRTGAGRDPLSSAAAEAVIRFAAEAAGTPYHVGRSTVAAVLPDRPGDAGWMRENVFRYISEVPDTPAPASVRRTVDRLLEMHRAKDPENRYMGLGAALDRLDRLYALYDVWRPEPWDGARR